MSNHDYTCWGDANLDRTNFDSHKGWLERWRKTKVDHQQPTHSVAPAYSPMPRRIRTPQPKPHFDMMTNNGVPPLNIPDMTDARDFAFNRTAPLTFPPPGSLPASQYVRNVSGLRQPPKYPLHTSGASNVRTSGCRETTISRIIRGVTT